MLYQICHITRVLHEEINKQSNENTRNWGKKTYVYNLKFYVTSHQVNDLILLKLF